MAVASDLKVRGATTVEHAVQDLADLSSHEALLTRADRALGGVTVALIAHGTLPDQRACERSWEETETAWRVNFVSAASLMHHFARYFVGRGGGTLVVISSVAGDRGRQSNYVYGTAKGALTVYAQGMRNRLSSQGVRVITIKPGQIDTPMTTAFKKGILWVQPEVVARGIVRAIRGQREVVYLPWFWRGIMVVIRAIPERIFKRMRL